MRFAPLEIGRGAPVADIIRIHVEGIPIGTEDTPAGVKGIILRGEAR